MKKISRILFILAINFIVLFHQACFAKILDDKGVLLPEVLEVFRQYKPLIEKCKSDICQKKGLSPEQIDQVFKSTPLISEISLPHLNDIAQVVFLRPASLERKDARHLKDKFLPMTNAHVLKTFRSIGDIDTVYPKKPHYRYILLNGSTVQDMRHRIQTLIHLVKSKKLRITPETEIVFLSGERDLYPEENADQLMNGHPLKKDPAWKKPAHLPKTEDQAAEWIWHQALLPASLRQAKITFVRAKKKETLDPTTKVVTWKRPTTFDTVQTWLLDHKPEPGSCLSVSSQPYVYYQEATIFGLFKKTGMTDQGFTVEGAGCQNNSRGSFRENISLILDNFARTIYTVVQNERS